jgi:hypothetical protein
MSDVPATGVAADRTVGPNQNLRIISGCARNDAEVRFVRGAEAARCTTHAGREQVMSSGPPSVRFMPPQSCLKLGDPRLGRPPFRQLRDTEGHEDAPGDTNRRGSPSSQEHSCT